MLHNSQFSPWVFRHPPKVLWEYLEPVRNISFLAKPTYLTQIIAKTRKIILGDQLHLSKTCGAWNLKLELVYIRLIIHTMCSTWQLTLQESRTYAHLVPTPATFKTALDTLVGNVIFASSSLYGIFGRLRDRVTLTNAEFHVQNMGSIFDSTFIGINFFIFRIESVKQSTE